MLNPAIVPDVCYYCHNILGQRTRLVRTNDAGAAKRFDAVDTSDQDATLGHISGRQGKEGRDGCG